MPEEFASASLSHALRLLRAARSFKAKSEALEQLDRSLAHPRDLLESGILDPAHPLISEARVLAEAFESLVIGMEDTQAWSELEAWPRPFVLKSWQKFLWTLRAVYLDSEHALWHLRHFQGRGRPAELIQQLISWLQNPLTKARALPPALQRLKKDLLRTWSVWEFALKDWETAVCTAREEILESLFTDFLPVLRRTHPAAAERLCVWTVSKCEDYDLDPNWLWIQWKPFWGTLDASRILAVGLSSHDTMGGFLFWTRHLAELCRLAPPSDPWRIQAWTLWREWRLALGAGALPQEESELCQNLLSWCPEWTEETKTLKPHPLSPKPTKPELQLELFAS